ncbi:hypothetical protein SAMN02745181_0846 [Rubritalea squalenifaciens DSM 18772]|uniref:Uncharacterized protein n=1 Tax=Rubritalea squalenifaciens DSM 18772 TaxID=1123071 RepID=A0A1M6DVS1_9BACT|nr:hypothetical protein [Rubritalea squalenifaciens]SHI77253.1 hypothetical protein SAMN02745181_0846 [Rubritalea squalenifaciens DSM 18772]
MRTKVRVLMPILIAVSGLIYCSAEETFDLEAFELRIKALKGSWNTPRELTNEDAVTWAKLAYEHHGSVMKFEWCDRSVTYELKTPTEKKTKTITLNDAQLYVLSTVVGKSYDAKEAELTTIGVPQESLLVSEVFVKGHGVKTKVLYSPLGVHKFLVTKDGTFDELDFNQSDYESSRSLLLFAMICGLSEELIEIDFKTREQVIEAEKKRNQKKHEGGEKQEGK